MKPFEALKRTEIAEIFKVDVRTITRWLQDGLPKRADGRYNLPECIAWRVEVAERAAGEAAGTKESPEASKWLERYRRERALLARLERRQKQSRLITKEKVIAEFAARAADLKNSFRQYRHRLTALLEGKTHDEIAAILSTENDRLLESFCRNGRYITNPDSCTESREQNRTGEKH